LHISYVRFNRYESNDLSTPEHGGTHVDAPAHFYKNGYKVQDITASRLVGPVVVVDVKAKAAANPSYRLTEQDLLVSKN
jgi:kynurenine formamidase